MTNRNRGRKLAQDAIDAGTPLAWFETLYREAEDNEAVIPWADMVANPNLADWFAQSDSIVQLNNSLVIGCGLGDDAEFIRQCGLEVTAFDLSRTAIEWCRKRFPNSTVDYLVADLLESADAWRRRFDLVVEIYTLQVLPAKLREDAISRIAECVRPGGTLLVIARGRDEAEDPGAMPWPLLRRELEHFVRCGLTEVRFEDYVDREDPPVRRFRVEYHRPE